VGDHQRDDDSGHDFDLERVAKGVDLGFGTYFETGVAWVLDL
jgi:hypothetical protein